MLNNVVIGKYLNVNSKIHQMNSICKILCTLLFITATFLNTKLEINLLLLTVTFLLMLMSNIDLKLYLKSIYSLRILIISILIINLICQTPLLSTLSIIIKMILIVLYTTILTLTTSTSELTYALEQIMKPLKLIKIPVNKLAFILTMAIRFIPTLIEEANIILMSLASRGMDYSKCNIKEKIKCLQQILIPMITISLKKGDALALSMELRLYNFNNRSNYNLNKWNTLDSFQFLFHFVLLLVVVKGV